MSNKKDTCTTNINQVKIKLPKLDTKLADLILPSPFSNLVERLIKVSKFHANFRLGETLGDLLSLSKPEIEKLPGIGLKYSEIFEELQLLVQSNNLEIDHDEKTNNLDEYKNIYQLIKDENLDDYILPEHYQKTIKRLRNSLISNSNSNIKIKTFGDIIDLNISEVSSLPGVGNSYIETLKEFKNLLKRNPKFLLIKKNLSSSLSENIDFDKFNFPSLQTKLTDIKLPNKYLKLIKRLRKVSENTSGFNLGETLYDLINLPVSELKSLPGVGASYVQTLQDLKLLFAITPNKSSDKEKIDISSVDFTNMRVSYCNIDEKFTKSLEKYAKYLGIDNFTNNVVDILNIDQESLNKIPGFGNTYIEKLIEFKNLVHKEIESIATSVVNYKNFESTIVFPIHSNDLTLLEVEKILLEDIDSYFDKLDDEDIDIAQKRWGFIEKKETLEEVAMNYNVTRERVRQKEYKINNKFLQHLRLSPEGLWEIILPELDSDIILKLKDLFYCFSNEKDFLDFIEFICKQKDVFEYIYPNYEKSIFNIYFIEYGAPIHINTLQEFLQEDKGTEIINFNNLIRFFAKQDIISIKEQYIWPKTLKKHEAAACILIDHPKGLPWSEIARLINTTGYSRYKVHEDRLDNTFSDSPDFIYLAGKGIYKNVSFINKSISLDILFNELNKYFQTNKRTTFHLNECYLALPYLKNFDYYDVRYFVKNFGEDYGFYFNGSSQADSISLEKNPKQITQRDVIIEKMNNSQKPLTAVEIASLLKSKSIDHAGFYIDKLLDEGSIVQIERMLYTTPQVAYKNIDINTYINAINSILLHYSKPVEPSIFKEQLNSKFSNSYSKFFYASIARLYYKDKGWFRKQSLYSINPIPFNSLKSILDTACDINKSNSENLAALEVYVAITKETASRAIINWKNTFK